MSKNGQTHFKSLAANAILHWFIVELYVLLIQQIQQAGSKGTSTA